MDLQDAQGTLQPLEISQPRTPVVEDLNHLTDLREVVEQEDDGSLSFKHTKFTLFDEQNFTAWTGRVDLPKRHLTPEIATQSLQAIPDHEIYPLVPPGVASMEASEYVPSEDTWVKGLNIQAYNLTAGSAHVANQVLEEIKAYQLIAANPHSNLAEFRGCLTRDNRVVGILLKRYATTLKARVAGQSQNTLDRETIVENIGSGLSHLHSLGMAHNDINPSNIMFDENDRLVIIDLGASRQIGNMLSQTGTPGWNEGFDRTSSIRNDEIGFGKIQEWLLEKDIGLKPAQVASSSEGLSAGVYA